MTNAKTNGELLCHQYCKALWRELSPAPQLRKRAVRDMKNSLSEFVEHNPDVTWDDIEKEFGSPHDSAENILNSLDSKQIRKEAKRFRWRRIFLVSILVIAMSYVLLSCGRLVISRIMQPGFVVVESAIVDEGPMPTNTPIEERGLV